MTFKEYRETCLNAGLNVKYSCPAEAKLYNYAGTSKEYYIVVEFVKCDGHPFGGLVNDDTVGMAHSRITHKNCIFPGKPMEKMINDCLLVIKQTKINKKLKEIEQDF
jgi:hypothetical protein